MSYVVQSRSSEQFMLDYLSYLKKFGYEIVNDGVFIDDLEELSKMFEDFMRIRGLKIQQVLASNMKDVQKEKLYRVWNQMKVRCNPDNHEKYPRYAGRGIVVCDEWQNSYALFKEWAFDNGYRIGLYIDRIDNDGHYTPANCRWVDYLTSGRNKSQITTSGRRYIPYSP